MMRIEETKEKVPAERMQKRDGMLIKAEWDSFHDVPEAGSCRILHAF